MRLRSTEESNMGLEEIVKRWDELKVKKEEKEEKKE